MKTFAMRALFKIATLAAAGTALSGCVYDVGLGYASDGYYDDYGCDPYGGYDSYYDCDYRSGFYNIGFGGGWYDSFYYPGYGYYLFDNYGRRHAMRDNHRRYWGEKRHNWYREHRGRDRDDYRGRGRGYTGNATPGAIGWPERNGGRVRDGDDNRRSRGDGQGRRGRNDQWRGGDGNGANAVPAPNPEMVQGRGRGEGYGRGQRGSANPAAGAVSRGGSEARRGGRGGGEGRSYRQPPQQSQPQPSVRQNDAPTYRPAPQQRFEGARQPSPNRAIGEGSAERPE